MKKVYLSAAVILLSVMGNAWATCPTPFQGPFFSGPSSWANYTQAQSCYTTGNSPTPTSISCFSEPSWSFGSGNGYAQTSFTVGATDWVGNTSHWNAGSWVDFSSPSGSAMDNFEIDVDVTHPNYTVSRYTVLYWNGAYGSISSCNGQKWAYFSANHGDTITITVRASNSGTATIKVSVPRIFSQTP